MQTCASESTPSLIRRRSGGGQDVCCPKCEVEQDVLAFKPLGMADKHADALNVVLKCASCRHIFSPKFLAES